MASLTTLSSVLKDFYLGPIVNQLNNEVLALTTFQKSQVEWQGKKAIMPVKVGRNTGVGFVAESGALPTAGNQQYADLQINARYVYGRFTVTGQSISASKTNAGAFVQALSSEMDGIVEDVKNSSDRACFSGGSVIGYVWEKANQAAFQYAGATTSADGSAFTLGGATTTAELRRMDTYALVGVATRVNAVTETTITFNAAIDTSAVPAGVVLAVVLPAASIVKYNTAAGWDLEPAGIQANLSAPSHFGVDRTSSTNATLRATHKVVDPSTDVYSSLTLSAFQRLLDQINLDSGVKPDLLLMNDLMKVEFTSLLQGVSAANLFVPTDKKSDGHAGFESLFFNGIEIKSSRQAPKGLIYALATKAAWKLAVLEDLGFMDEDGNVLFRVANTDAYEGTARWYYNLVCNRPNTSGLLCAVSFS